MLAQWEERAGVGNSTLANFVNVKWTPWRGVDLSCPETDLPTVRDPESKSPLGCRQESWLSKEPWAPSQGGHCPQRGALSGEVTTALCSPITKTEGATSSEQGRKNRKTRLKRVTAATCAQHTCPRVWSEPELRMQSKSQPHEKSGFASDQVWYCSFRTWRRSEEPTGLEVQSRSVEEEFCRVVIMLAMNLIKVFPAWYHPSLTWSVTHAQISQLTYPFITTTEEGCEKEGTDAVGYFWFISTPLLALLSDWWGVHPQRSLGLRSNFFFSFDLFNMKSIHHIPSRIV